MADESWDAPAPAATSNGNGNHAPIPAAFSETEPQLTPKEELEKQYSQGDPTDAPETPVKKADPAAPPEGDELEAAPAPVEGAGEAIDEGLEARAKAFGLDDAEISQFLNNAHLEKYVERLEGMRQPAAATPPAAAAKEPEKKAEIVPEFKLDLKPEDYDPGILKALNDMNAHYAAKTKALEESFSTRISGLQSHVQAEQSRQNEAALDNTFLQLGKEYTPFVGEKSLAEMGAHSPQGKTRIAIVKQAQIIEAGYAANNAKAPDVATIMRQAASIVLGSKVKAVATQAVRSNVQARRGQFLARGTAVRGTDARNPVDRARAAVNSMIRERGLSSDED